MIAKRMPRAGTEWPVVAAALAAGLAFGGPTTPASAQVRARAEAPADDGGRDQTGLDVSVGLFATGATLGALGNAGTLLFSFAALFAGGFDSPWSELVGVSVFSWVLGAVTLIVASVLHAASRGRPVGQALRERLGPHRRAYDPRWRAWGPDATADASLPPRGGVLRF